MKHSVATFLFAFGLCVFVFPVLGSQGSTNTLPPDAQEAVKKGILAAKNQDYERAIRYFEDARKITNAPEIFYYLALAESQIPGRELRAICWFGAFLTAEPNSPKVSAIWDKIDELGIKNEGNISKLITASEDAANRLEGKQQLGALIWVADLRVRSGDRSQARFVCKEIENLNISALPLQVKDTLLAVQLDAGDFEGAANTIATVQSSDRGSLGGLRMCQNLMAEDLITSTVFAQAMAGNYFGAEKTASFLDNDRRKRAKEHIEYAKTNGTPIYGHWSVIWITNCPSVEAAREWLKPVSTWDSKTATNTVSDWLTLLESETSEQIDIALNCIDANIRPNTSNTFNTPVFVNYAKLLKSQQSGEPRRLFDALIYVAMELQRAQTYQVKMLQQIKTSSTAKNGL